MTRPSRLRALLTNETLAVPGVFHAYSARILEQAGFRAAYLSGAGLSAARAMPDIGLLTLTDVAVETHHITQAVSVPLLVDADTGFGDVQQVYRSVQELEASGAAGIQIEDQTFPKRCGHLEGKQVINPQAMCEKIAAAVEARRDPELLIIARTDARAVEGLDGAIHRGRLYAEAGAAAIFPEALESAEEFQAFARAMNEHVFLVANMTEWGKTPFLSLSEFASLGYHVVLFPMTLFRMAARAMDDALAELRATGTQRGMLDRMQTRRELYEVLRYAAYEAWEERITGKQGVLKKDE